MDKKDELGWRWWLWPLRSRKVQIAMVTIIVAWLSHAGFDVDSEKVLGIFAIGVALILGIAHEDAGQKRAGRD